MNIPTKKIVKYLLGFLITLIVILSAAAIGLRLYFDDERLRSVAADLAAEYIDADFKIGKIDISLFSSINVDGIYIVSETDTIIGCDGIAVSYSLSRLLSGELYVKGVSLNHPSASLKTSPEGELDLSWLKLPKGRVISDESRLAETAADTAASLPVIINLRELKITGAKIKVAGAQEINVDGLDIWANNLNIAAIDSISGKIQLNSDQKEGLSVSYSYSDSLGELAFDGLLKLEINSKISPGNKISGLIKMSAEPLHTEIYGYSKSFNLDYSSDFNFDLPNSQLSVGSVEMALNKNELLSADFRMEFAQSDTIFPMELLIESAQLDLAEINDLVKANIPGTELTGKLSAKNIALVINEVFSGMKIEGNASIENLSAKIPEYGIDLRNFNLNAITKGIVMGADAGYILELNGHSDSIFYAVDETTTIGIPSADLAFSGRVDSLFMPDSISGRISLNGLFGDTLATTFNLVGGIPPRGSMSIHLDVSRMKLDDMPYLDYAGFVSVGIDGNSRGDKFNFNGQAAITELFLRLEDDSLLIPELPVDFAGQIRFDQTYTSYFIQQYLIKSPSLFEISGNGKFISSPNTEFSSEFDAIIWHKYLEDFIPIGLRDSLGRVKLTGESRLNGGCSMVVDSAGTIANTMSGAMKSKMDTAAVELYSFNAQDIQLITQFDLIDDNFKAKCNFGIMRFAFEDTLMLPFADISGQTSLAYRDSTFSWENATMGIKSHHLNIVSRGNYIVSDSPTMTMNSGIEFQSKDTVEVMKNVGITGRFQATMELAMNDSLLSLRGSLTPLLLSVISPGVFSIESITGSIPFEQDIALPQLRLISNDNAVAGLNLLDYEKGKYYRREKTEGSLSFERMEAGRVYIENFDLTIEVGNGRIIGRRLFSDVYGGNLLGDFYLDLKSIDFGAVEIKPDSLRYAANFQLSGVNFDRLAGSQTISQSADICGDISLVGRGIVDPQSNFELEGQLNITKIGSRATRKLLDFLDPTGTDLSIAETRKLIDRKILFLDMSYQPKRFSMKIKHGNINPTIDMDQPFYAKYLRIGAVTMPVEYDRKQLQTMLKAAAATPIEE